MIATLSGVVSEKLTELIVIEAGGVGYGVLVTASDYGNLTQDAPVKLYIHEYLREDTHDLYGFTHKGTKTFFDQLLSVNGVGPRMALHILDIAPAEEVRQAIANGDTKLLQTAQGVGKRVAERVVVDLKDKVGLVAGDIDSMLAGSAQANHDEAVQALLALGYTQADALQALHKVDSSLPVEDRIKQALKDISV